jgi:sugar O-acyltransferase (sialic acid O-acetyltransferase NeuD family)
MAQRLLILGAGGHGRSVADAITACGDHVVGFLDDALPAGTLVNGTSVLGGLSLASDLNQLFEASDEAPPDQVVVAIGNPALRQTWQQVLEQVAVHLGVVLHPRAIVSATAQLGPGSVVLAGAVVNANASLHQGVLVNSGAVVDHDAICGAYSQLGVNAAMAGGSRLGPLACLAPGEVLACRQTRFAGLELAPGASDPGEGLTLKP